MNCLILIKPTKEYQKQIVDMLDEWTSYNLTHKGNDSPFAIFHDYSDFDSYLQYFDDEENNPKDGLVHASTYFALDKERNIIVGAVNIRHYLNEKLRNGGGHIGDGIRPSERRKGFATEMIGLALIKCKEMGMVKVMMSCNSDNIASRKSIINNGGVLERIIEDEDGPLEIYWINL